MKIAAFVLTPVLLLVLCFILFASNRVLIVHEPPIPTLAPQNDLPAVTTSNARTKVCSLDGTVNGKKCTVKLTAFPLAWGAVVLTSSAQVKQSIEDDHRELKRIMGAQVDDLTNAREFPVNGKPGCVFVLTRTGNAGAYAKVLEFVAFGAQYRLSSSVKGGKISARDKAEADVRFERTLSDLRKAIK